MSTSNLNRRRFLLALPVAAGIASLAAAPTLPAGPRSSGSGQRSGQTYKNITYRTFLIDFQFTDIDPDTMKRADAEKLAEQTAETGADSLMVYAMTASGIALYKRQFSPKFKNLPDNFLGDFLDACHKRKLKTVLYHCLRMQGILDVDHPDWAMLDAQGKPWVMHFTSYGFMGKTNFLCLNKEILDKTRFVLRQLFTTKRLSWRWMSSVRTGIVLIILWVGVASLGTVILQRPITSPETLASSYSAATLHWLDALGLTDVFHAWWFAALLALLGMNIFFASLERLPGVWRFFASSQRMSLPLTSGAQRRARCRSAVCMRPPDICELREQALSGGITL